MTARSHIILHATQSVDGATVGFPYDVELHYDVLADIDPQAMLVGSVTGLSASRNRPEEDQTTMQPPRGATTARGGSSPTARGCSRVGSTRFACCRAFATSSS